ncbi:hypothetical protein GP486_003077 [Trichoglossum hirsutum]|uniref:NACHT domain-containing protein n=1 Tax=Trichoglossum hirsutum TaxID=265104 RepID=A0A9P8LDL5_9PEZI|nr:hypothetical protein GP486_003077 [Trichoglossum hirsutum]
MGTNSAAAVASQMRMRFVSIQYVLMVGIGGGVPGAQVDVRLGDVVISQPNSRYGGVVQYDFGKIGSGGVLTRTGFLNAPPAILLGALAAFQSSCLTGHSNLSTYLSEVASQQERFSPGRAGLDVLFEPGYDHTGGLTCDQCSRDRVVERPSRRTQGPVVHYGTIASGNVVMKDGVTRDSWSEDLGGVLCFEMEAAGLMSSIPCLVIRGICDYADSHKNKAWQPYAAATAAACAKDILSHMPSAESARTSADEAQNSQCLTDLRLTDPRFDKDRIEASKDKLLRDSYTWILDDSAFLDWRDNKDTRLLWIRGDPGKGKTMMMIGLVDELSRRLRATPGSGVLSYFFCQSTDPRLNNAVSVLRGLIYTLVNEERILTKHLRKRYDSAGRQLFEDTNAFYTLSAIFLDMLNDPSLGSVFLMIDAIDECDSGLPQLLKLIAPHDSRTSSKVKWLVASRNRLDIEEELRPDTLRLKISLELNASQVSRAVSAFIDFKVSELAGRKKYDSKLRDEVRNYLCEKAEGTFLWVALVCKKLQRVLRNPKVPAILREFPSGLEPLYERMVEQVQQGEDPEDVEFCLRILSTVTLTYRPIHLKELAAAAGLPEGSYDDLESLNVLVDLCGSFLTVREEMIYFVHQSAKDYFSTGKGSKIFPSGQSEEHVKIASRSLGVMSTTLKRDICKLEMPGVLLSEVEGSINKGPLAHIKYACCHWVSHLHDAGTLHDQLGLRDGGKVHLFLHNHFLHWLEALSLIGNVPDGVVMLSALEHMLIPNTAVLLALVQDAKRFLLYNRSIIERAPLQVYVSALVFSPKMSLIRRLSLSQFPRWIKGLPVVEEDWNPSLQTLEGHSGRVSAVSFSQDGQFFVSASQDKTVKLWETRTGALRSVLEGHSGWVNAVAFSPDSQLLASASDDKTVRLWDARTGTSRSLEGHSDRVKVVAFSPDGQLLASASYDKTVRLWDVRVETSHSVLEGHSGWVNAVAFSPDSQLLASASVDKTVRLWDTRTRVSRGILKGHSDSVSSVAFSPDGQLLASASHDKRVRLWDARTRVLYGALRGHLGLINAVVFSPDGQLLASASGDRTIMLWDTRTGTSRSVLEGHSRWVNAVAFSPDGQLLASASDDMTVRLWDAGAGASCGILKGHLHWVNAVAFSPNGQLLITASHDKMVRLWDVRIGTSCGITEGHSGGVSAVAFSPDSQLLASASVDKTVRLWDTRTRVSRGILKGHSGWVRAVAFSPDGQLLASAAHDKTVRLWDVVTGTLRSVLIHPGGVAAVAFSFDGQLLASTSYDETIRIWDVRTGVSRGILQGHSGWIKAVIFSPDGRFLASASSDRIVILWDARTQVPCSVLEGHSDGVNTVAFSPDSQLLASASYDKTVRLWDTRTGALRSVLEGHSDWVNVVAFSPDGQLLASASYDKTVRLWDVRTGTPRSVLIGHPKDVTEIVFSFDGQLLASTSYDETIRIWDARTGVSRGILQGHSDGISAVIFSPDGRFLASASSDKTVGIWEFEAREVIRGLSFSSDESHPKTPHGLLELRLFSPRVSHLDPELSCPISVKDHWVVWGLRKVLWLPPEYRRATPEKSMGSNVLALRHASGRVTFMEFDLGDIPGSYTWTQKRKRSITQIEIESG